MSNLEVERKRRDKHDIIAEILKAAVNSQFKTHLMFRVRLSHAQLTSYLTLLINKGLIETFMMERGKHGLQLYRTTAKGIQFIKNLQLISELLEASTNLENEPDGKEVKPTQTYR